MDGKPTDERPSPGEAADEAPRSGAEEDYGPLELTRLAKDDGRALLVFRHAERP